MTPSRPDALIVVKIGGELIETAAKAAQIGRAVTRLSASGPLVVVHGGGKDIDAESARRGLAKVAVDGLRLTDPATLEAVIAALAGTVNTRLVAALVAQGVPAVGLTGADARAVPATRTPLHRTRDGRDVDLGLVGDPDATSAPRLLLDLLAHGYVPVLASLGCTADGTILNVNADTLAAAVARQLRAGRLIVAGATPGVLDADGATLPAIDPTLLDALIADGRATAGMIAKLRACRAAFDAGIHVSIVDGRGGAALDEAAGTRLVPAASHHTVRAAGAHAG